MQTIHNPNEIQEKIIALRSEGKRIGFVPTMGALHDGHMSLVREARKNCDILVLSIFVNPLQFAPSEDLDKYPRTLDEDSKLAEIDGVDFIFAPSARAMYPTHYDSSVSCGGITGRLEGSSRPGHFDGVTTVVLKLFNIVQPHFSVFGQKDAQQSLVIKKMVADLNLPVEVIVAPTVREQDGLAMSSRNRYLTDNERAEVSIINNALENAKSHYLSGVRSSEEIHDAVFKSCSSSKLITIEYIAITDTQCQNIEKTIEEQALLSLAVRTKESNTRLIDNIMLMK